METFKTETHLHTLEGSPDGRLPAAELVRMYHEAGYSTICISDHVKQGYFDKLGDIPWEEKVKILFMRSELSVHINWQEQAKRKTPTN